MVLPWKKVNTNGKNGIIQKYDQKEKNNLRAREYKIMVVKTTYIPHMCIVFILGTLRIVAVLFFP